MRGVPVLQPALQVRTLVQQLLEPELIDLVDDDEQELVVLGGARALGAQDLVEGQLRVDLAPVGEQLGPARYPGPLRGHQHAALGRLGKLHLPQLDQPAPHEVQRAGLHRAHPDRPGRMRSQVPLTQPSKRFAVRRAC